MEKFFVYFYSKKVPSFRISCQANEEKVTSNKQRVKDNEQQARSNEQRAKNNEQRAKSNEQQAKTTCNEQISTHLHAKCHLFLSFIFC